MHDKEEDIFFMRMAIEEAGIAFAEGEVPVGAVLTRNGDVVARAHNCRESSHDPQAMQRSWHSGQALMRAAAGD